MRYGIPMREFYALNPTRLQRYQPFLNEWMKQHEIETDIAAWQHGSYVQRAIGSSLSRGHRYPTQPYSLDRMTVSEDGEVREMTDAERFWAWANSRNEAMEIKAIDEKIAAERAERAKEAHHDEPDGNTE